MFPFQGLRYVYLAEALAQAGALLYLSAAVQQGGTQEDALLRMRVTNHDINGVGLLFFDRLTPTKNGHGHVLHEGESGQRKWLLKSLKGTSNNYQFVTPAQAGGQYC